MIQEWYARGGAIVSERLGDHAVTYATSSEEKLPSAAMALLAEGGYLEPQF